MPTNSSKEKLKHHWKACRHQCIMVTVTTAYSSDSNMNSKIKIIKSQQSTSSDGQQAGTASSSAGGISVGLEQTQQQEKHKKQQPAAMAMSSSSCSIGNRIAQCQVVTMAANSCYRSCSSNGRHMATAHSGDSNCNSKIKIFKSAIN